MNAGGCGRWASRQTPAPFLPRAPLPAPSAPTRPQLPAAAGRGARRDSPVGGAGLGLGRGWRPDTPRPNVGQRRPRERHFLKHFLL